jgi:hypothetical protein
MQEFDANPEAEGLARSQEPLQILEECQQNDFGTFLTHDKLGFSPSTPNAESEQHLETKCPKK